MKTRELREVLNQVTQFRGNFLNKVFKFTSNDAENLFRKNFFLPINAHRPMQFLSQVFNVNVQPEFFKKITLHKAF